MQGKFIVITGPSASGKSTLVNALLNEIANSGRLITVTTRTPRFSEIQGSDYFFVSQEEFQKRLEEGEFFEHAEVYGNLYGSSKKVLANFLGKHVFTFAIIDVQGSLTLKEKLPGSFIIFVRPGSIKDVGRRLTNERMEIASEEIQKRLETVEAEMQLATHFDAVVENFEGKCEDTVRQTLSFIK
jgi:guanylate kinase